MSKAAGKAQFVTLPVNLTGVHAVCFVAVRVVIADVQVERRRAGGWSQAGPLDDGMMAQQLWSGSASRADQGCSNTQHTVSS